MLLNCREFLPIQTAHRFHPLNFKLQLPLKSPYIQSYQLQILLHETIVAVLVSQTNSTIDLSLFLLS